LFFKKPKLRLILFNPISVDNFLVKFYKFLVYSALLAKGDEPVQKEKKGFTT